MNKPGRLSDRLYERLRANIIQGLWPVGFRLNEEKLAKELHVSRTPLREALQRIYREGLLDYGKHRGYFVRIVTEDDVREIYKIRTALEILAFTEAARGMEEGLRQDIEALLRQAVEAASSGDAEGVLVASAAFNQRIYEAANMPRLVLIEKNLEDYLRRFRDYSFRGEANLRRVQAVQEHQAIFRAMHQKEYEVLAELIRDHLARSEAYVLEVLRENPT